MSNYKTLKESKFVDLTNIVDSGNEGTKVATGTTAQRGSTTGQWRYNTSTGFFEGRNDNGSFSSLEPSPTVISVDVTSIESAAGGNETIVLTGTNFAAGGTVKFIANDATEVTASTSTFNNTSTYTAVVARSSFANAKEPYDVRFISSSGLQATLDDAINVDNSPVWSTAAGSLGSIEEDATGNHFTVSASDPEGDTVAYSLQSGSLGGLSINSSSGVISGDPTDVSGSATLSFTLRATAGGKTADRSFSITVTDPILNGSTSAKAARSCKKIFDLGSSYQGSSANGLYYITNYGTISAEQHYCLMDTNYSSGGWTLLYSGSSARDDWGGSNYQFNLGNSTTPNGGTNLYARNRSGTFTPTTSDKFMIRRHDNNDFKVHTVGTWRAGSNWQAHDGHYYLSDSGSTVDASGNTMSRGGVAFDHFECCAGSGGCSGNGGDLCGFGTGNSNGCYNHNSGNDECFGGAWATGGSSQVNISWGRNNNIEGTFTSYWFRRDSNSE